MTPTVDDIRIASPSDHAAITRTLVAELRALPICHWLVPDIRVRDRILAGYLGLRTEHLLEHGQIQVIDAPPSRGGFLHAVAGWLPPGAPRVASDHHDQVAAIAGQWAERFTELEAALTTAANRTPVHHRLTVLAVRRRAHSHGTGSLLLAHHLRLLDQLRQPTALVAASPRSISLYTRHGYLPWGEPIAIAPSPDRIMTPMHRPATAHAPETGEACGVPAARAAGRHLP